MPLDSNVPDDAELAQIEEEYLASSEWFEDEASKRSLQEMAYDEAVLATLKDGKDIKEAIKEAGKQYPKEILRYEEDQIDEVELYYRNLLDHTDIKEKLEYLRSPKELNLGIAWYDNSESFDAMKQFSTDPDIWEDTYEQWLESCSNSEAEMRRDGLAPIHVSITVQGLSEYCKEHDKEPNAATRAEYVSHLLLNKGPNSTGSLNKTNT